MVVIIVCLTVALWGLTIIAKHEVNQTGLNIPVTFEPTEDKKIDVTIVKSFRSPRSRL